MESAPGYIAYQYLANHIFDEVVFWCSNAIPSTIFNEAVAGSSNMLQDTFKKKFVYQYVSKLHQHILKHCLLLSNNTTFTFFFYVHMFLSITCLYFSELDL